jgi:hypothetical protein
MKLNSSYAPMLAEMKLQFKIEKTGGVENSVIHHCF